MVDVLSKVLRVVYAAKVRGLGVSFFPLASGFCPRSFSLDAQWTQLTVIIVVVTFFSVMVHT